MSESGRNVDCTVRRIKTVKYDIDLLDMLQEPICTYDIKRKLNIPYATAHSIIREYVALSLVDLVYEETVKGHQGKRFYRLSKLGLLFRELVKELEVNLSHSIQ